MPDGKEPDFEGIEKRVVLDLYAKETEDSLLTADGLDAAIVGVARRCGQPNIVVYSIPKAIEVLVARGMTEEEAAEYLEFNSIGAWVGDQTPAWMTPIEEIAESYMIDGRLDEKAEKEKVEDG